MDEEILLLVKKRKNGFVAPFINGWNVWEIEEKHWVESVKYAILHAYELGKTHCIREIDKKIGGISMNFLKEQWPEPEQEYPCVKKDI